MKTLIKNFIYPLTGIKHHGKVIDSKNGSDVIECEICGFKHIIPIPTLEELDNLYKKEFYSKKKPKYIKNVEEDLDWWNRTYNRYYQLLEKYCPKGSRRLLEIGSGPGYFLKYGKGLGWDVLGFEPSKKAYKYSLKLGVNVANVFFNKKNVSKYGKFDVVYLETVIEHLPDPVSAIETIKSILKPQGVICIVAPNDYNPLQTILRENLGFKNWWVGVPQHINYFDFKSIKKLLKKLKFEIVESTGNFPMEFFLLSGINYVGNDKLGRKCQARRKIFENNMYKYGGEYLNFIYKSLSDYGIGREFIIIGRPIL